ncbi:hypothetical protein ACTXJG_17200, partial [Glutamicibacter arilaitensis]|uniref:hypothetical protein n=1 Tax=Glutamicibacter arilaitensis TaxID=256701 RepID=UPI003FD645FA
SKSPQKLLDSASKCMVPDSYFWVDSRRRDFSQRPMGEVIALVGVALELWVNCKDLITFA